MGLDRVLYIYIHTLKGLIAIHDLRIYKWAHLAVWAIYYVIYYGPLYLLQISITGYIKQCVQIKGVRVSVFITPPLLP